MAVFIIHEDTASSISGQRCAAARRTQMKCGNTYQGPVLTHWPDNRGESVKMKGFDLGQSMPQAEDLWLGLQMTGCLLCLCLYLFIFIFPFPCSKVLHLCSHKQPRRHLDTKSTFSSSSPGSIVWLTGPILMLWCLIFITMRRQDNVTMLHWISEWRTQSPLDHGMTAHSIALVKGSCAPAK